MVLSIVSSSPCLVLSSSTFLPSLSIESAMCASRYSSRLGIILRAFRSSMNRDTEYFHSTCYHHCPRRHHNHYQFTMHAFSHHQHLCHHLPHRRPPTNVRPFQLRVQCASAAIVPLQPRQREIERGKRGTNNGHQTCVIFVTVSIQKVQF